MDAKDLEHYELASAVQKLVNEVVVAQGSPRIIFGTRELHVQWETGPDDDLATPKDKPLAELTFAELATSIRGAAHIAKLMLANIDSEFNEAAVYRGELAYAVQKLANATIDANGAFGMTFGDGKVDVEWQAGCSTDDMAFPKHGTVDKLSVRHMTATIIGAVESLELMLDYTSPGVTSISTERGRQLVQGRTERTDQQYESGELVELAKVMLEGDASPLTPGLGPVTALDFLNKYPDTERRLAVAGALIAAELDRIRYKKIWEERESARKQRVQGQ